MITRLSLLFALLAAPAVLLHAEFPEDIATAENQIIPGKSDADWQPVLADLKAKPPLKANFEEHRFYPFRKNFTKLTGEIRLDPVRGLSLHYLTPDDRLMVIDDKGGFMKDEKGRRRDLPDDPRAQAATTALLHVLRFDLVELAKNFDLYGARDGEFWRFTFVPRPGPLSGVLNPITVTGDSGLVRRIEMRKSSSQRVEIIIGETATGVTFSADELARFFR
ncbi:MAG: outer membrane lipoprotein carrier protein LolA [Opitutaceae bacterium]|jgi:hypothetical protein